MRKITSPVSIPAPGSKVIEEYVGRASTGWEHLSVAHMIAPPGWTEPFQRPDFAEITVVVRGSLVVEHDAGQETILAGEALVTESGERIRYANPSEEFAEYWSICLPAFDDEAAHRSA